MSRRALSWTLHMSFSVRSDKSLTRLDVPLWSRLSRFLTAHVESTKANRGREAVQDSRDRRTIGGRSVSALNGAAPCSHPRRLHSRSLTGKQQLRFDLAQS